ncbi:hypothetical protein BDV93DRAFT_513602 [Ceratobasidium sp. AG-I]|nr:hypothetical protein BDV93DRAFT_513602 [Ceratobasidium sp. AG-I]
MSNYRRDSYSDRDVDDYSDHQPGNNHRNNRGQPPVYRDDRYYHGAEVCDRRRDNHARQPTMEENLVSLALLNARNKCDQTRVNLINRGNRPFHPVRRGTHGGARRHGHGGPPHIPPRGDEPVSKQSRSGPVPNAGARRAFPQAMNPNCRGPINDRLQAHRAGLATNADDPLNGAAGRLEYRLDTVHLVIDEVIASATELRVYGLSGGDDYGYRSSRGGSRDYDINDQLERLDIRGSVAGSERGRTVGTHLATNGRGEPSATCRSRRSPVPERSIHRASGTALVLRPIPDSSSIDPSSESKQPDSSGTEGARTDDGIRRRQRDGGADGPAERLTDRVDSNAGPGIAESLEEPFIDYDAGAANVVEPEVGVGSVDVQMSDQAAVALELQRFVAPKDLELKPKSKTVTIHFLSPVDQTAYMLENTPGRGVRHTGRRGASAVGELGQWGTCGCGVVAFVVPLVAVMDE